MENSKLQSAMEYLMTYGWAILIIAIVMVALFALGILGNPLSSSCTPQTGYLCQTPIASYNSAVVKKVTYYAITFNVIVGQETGDNWPSANVIWVAKGASPPLFPSSASGLCNIIAKGPQKGDIDIQSNAITTGITCATGITSLTSGGTGQVSFAFNAITVKPTIGTDYVGTLWAYYQISKGGTWYSAELAKANVRLV